jgi:hypothetical protein
LHLNTGAWTRDKDWPDWTTRYQREKWRGKGLILWDSETKTVARLQGRHGLALLGHFREHHEWEQEGCAVGEPAWLLSLDKPGDKGEATLSNQINLDPQQTAALLELLEKEERALEKLAEEEEEDERRALHKAYDLMLEWNEHGKDTVYDESLSWEENKRVMRQRYESGELPKELTWTEKRLYGEVLTELNEEYHREERKREERSRTMRKNLLNHHFFWERLKALWPNLRPDERLHTLQLLQDKEWDERALVEVRQIIENAQFFAALGEKSGITEGPHTLSPEELDLLLDVPDESLWNEMVALYPKRPVAATEDGAGEKTAHDVP